MKGIPTFFWWAPEGDPTAHELYEGPRDNTDERRDQDVIARHIGAEMGIVGDEDETDILIFDTPDGPPIGRLTIQTIIDYCAQDYCVLPEVP